VRPLGKAAHARTKTEIALRAFSQPQSTVRSRDFVPFQARPRPGRGFTEARRGLAGVWECITTEFGT
jgi:hypothetical protein